MTQRDIPSINLMRRLVPSVVAPMSILLAGCAGVAPGTSATDSNSLKGSNLEYTQGRSVVSANRNDRVVSVVWQGKYGFVRIEEAETAARSDHPVSLTPEQIRFFFSHLQMQEKNADPIPVFTQAELNMLANPVSLALSEATPDQDVTFVVADKRGRFHLVGNRVATSGRVFYRSGRLNVIFGEVHAAFEDQFRATGYMRPFKLGSRAERRLPSVISSADDAMQGRTEALREDWIRVEPSYLTRNDGKAVLPATPSTTPTSVPIAKDYEDLEKRLESLQRLRERNLITEEEFQQKRSAILGEF